MIVHDCKQGTSEWLMKRVGVPTASEFDNLVSPEWKIRTGQMPETYLFRKITEKCMGMPLQAASSFGMEQGTMLELEAIPWLEFMHDVHVDRVGFITTDDGRIGCSPDGLLGEDGGVEVKCPQPDTHLRYLVGGGVPKEYLAQVHGSMFVTGRKWWKFLSYSRQFPPLLVKVERDERIQAVLHEALSQFIEKFDALHARIAEIRQRDPNTKAA
jgi:hypothetical protein